MMMMNHPGIRGRSSGKGGTDPGFAAEGEQRSSTSSSGSGSSTTTPTTTTAAALHGEIHPPRQHPPEAPALSTPSPQSTTTAFSPSFSSSSPSSSTPRSSGSSQSPPSPTSSALIALSTSLAAKSGSISAFQSASSSVFVFNSAHESKYISTSTQPLRMPQTPVAESDASKAKAPAKGAEARTELRWTTMIDTSPSTVEALVGGAKIVPTRWSCESCRSRKIKCDGARPVCGNCSKRGPLAAKSCVFLGRKSRADDSNGGAAPDRSKGQLAAHRNGAQFHVHSLVAPSNTVSQVDVKPSFTPASSSTLVESAALVAEPCSADNQRCTRASAPIQFPRLPAIQFATAPTINPAVRPQLLMSAPESLKAFQFHTSTPGCGYGYGGSTPPVRKAVQPALHFPQSSPISSFPPSTPPPLTPSWCRPEAPDNEEKTLAVSFLRLPFIVPFIHTESYLKRIESADPFLRMAICTHASTMMSMPTEASDWYRNRARELSQTAVDSPSIEAVQAFLVMSFYSLRFANDVAGWQWLGMACRMAMFLELNIDPDDGWLKDRSWLEKESRRRTWFNCYFWDRMASAIRGRDSQIPRTPRCVSFICSDLLFFSNSDSSVLAAQYESMRGPKDHLGTTLLRHIELTVDAMDLSRRDLVLLPDSSLIHQEDALHASLMLFPLEAPHPFNLCVQENWLINTLSRQESFGIWSEIPLSIFSGFQANACVLYHRRIAMFLADLAEWLEEDRQSLLWHRDSNNRTAKSDVPPEPQYLPPPTAPRFNADYTIPLCRSLAASTTLGHQFTLLQSCHLRMPQTPAILLYFALEGLTSLLLLDSATVAIQSVERRHSTPRSALHPFAACVPVRDELTERLYEYSGLLKVLGVAEQCVDAFTVMICKLRKDKGASGCVERFEAGLRGFLQNSVTGSGTAGGGGGGGETGPVLEGNSRGNWGFEVVRWLERRKPLLQRMAEVYAAGVALMEA
ncbi:fungal-specific transcription factor domain-containing protein [Zopfochytrium polystomum]|nr:fungal-specific transcription factor domain-containing protein [Zopfochytrium polystomum]